MGSAVGQKQHGKVEVLGGVDAEEAALDVIELVLDHKAQTAPHPTEDCPFCQIRHRLVRAVERLFD